MGNLVSCVDDSAAGAPPADAHEILPRLYLGALSAAEDTRFLTAVRCTHVLTVHPFERPRLPKRMGGVLPSKIVNEQIKVGDNEMTVIGAHFDAALDFIRQHGYPSVRRVTVFFLMDGGEGGGEGGGAG